MINGDHSSSDEKENMKDLDEKKDQDLVFVQDVGFTVKITAPGVEQFDIQVWLLIFILSKYKE